MPANPQRPVSVESKRPLRVLVVEDSIDVAETASALLKHWGHDSRVCASGNEALALAPYFKPNVVLIDIGLPDMTGWELASRLADGVLLIAVMARGEQSDYERSEKAGISYHFVKPHYQKQLRTLLDRVAERLENPGA